MQTIPVLGIDPSLNNTGLSVVDIDIDSMKIAGVRRILMASTDRQTGKTVRKSSDDLRRAQSIIADIRGQIREHGVRIVAAEIPSGAQSASAAFANGLCVGCIASIRIPVVQVSPLETKMATVGSKTASKADIIRWALDRWPDADWVTGSRANDWDIQNAEGRHLTKVNEHMADALAIVEAALLTPEMRMVAAALRSIEDDDD